MKSDLEQERDSLVELGVEIIKAKERLITYETNFIEYDRTKHGHLQFTLSNAIESLRRYLIRYGHKDLLKGNYQ
jgi:hypothetical protein